MVRRCVAINIENISNNLPENLIKEHIYPIWKFLFLDILETVKACTIVSSKSILEKLVNHSDVIDYMVLKLKDIMLNK